MFKISPSSINLMNQCERCFWLEKHKVWKRPSSPFPSLPSGMDKILKIHFDKFMDKNLLPPELKECEKDCKLFNDKDLLKVWRNNLRGIRWEDNDGNIFFGAVDNILVKGKKLIVLDFKTKGFEIKEDAADPYHNQLNIYNFLLRKNNYETEDYAFLLFYAPREVLETGEVVFNNKLVKIEVNVKSAEKLFTKAINILNEGCPNNKCEWCENINFK